MKIYHVVALIFVAVFIYFFTATEIEVVSPGQGVIIGISGDVDIVTPDSGFITSMNIKAGDKIEKNQTLFSFNNLDVFYKKSSAETSIKSLKEKRESLQREVEDLIQIYRSTKSNENVDADTMQFNSRGKVFAKELNELRDQYQTLLEQKHIYQRQRKQLNLQINLIEKQNNLLRKSGSPEIELLENAKQLSQLNYAVIELDSKLITLSEDYDRKFNNLNVEILEQIRSLKELINELSLELISAQESLSHAERKTLANIVKSPVSGVVFDIIQNFTIGSYIEASQKVITIKQNQQQNLIEANISSKYRPFVQKNSNVKIVVSSPGYKHQENGIVTQISADSFLLDHGKQGEERFFKIVIKPEGRLSEDSSLIGVQANVFIINNEVTFMRYITSFLNEKIFFNVW